MQYADTLYPDSKEQEAEDEEEDIEASIAKEVAEMKGSKEKKRFANITTGTDCRKNNRTVLLYII